jgi:mono/diheme cytochrome c family protein
MPALMAIFGSTMMGCAPNLAVSKRLRNAILLRDNAMRTASSILNIVTFLLVSSFNPGNAQTFGDAIAGREIASVWCAGCHRISAQDRDVNRVPPDFGAIAGMSSMTELALRVFLQTPHGNMPRYQLSPKELDDIITYVLGLGRQ